jgi:pyrroloquinoline quinone biosynthesis protein E
VQLGLSGGEPLLRRDLETLVRAARNLGFYTNLITSAVGMDAERVAALRRAGLDHIQISFQASERALNDFLAGTGCFEHKLAMARAVKDNGFPMVLCFPLHRGNLHQTGDMLMLAESVGADYVELATVQYYGWALLNRDTLLPSRSQLEEVEKVVARFRRDHTGGMKIYYVVPDYHEQRPKACMNGWGSTFLAVTPDGTALPCHAARGLPGFHFPDVRDAKLADLWHHSEAFNRFRGFDWMQEPCRSCDEKSKDFGGCRCQAFLLTGDAANADPVCAKSPHHGEVVARVAAVETTTGETRPLVFRNPRNSRQASMPPAV